MRPSRPPILARFPAAAERVPARRTPTKELYRMGLLDKITGRAKKAAGDIADDPELRRQGRREEEKGKKKEQLEDAQDRAAQKAQEVSDLERKT
jgi:uncharacterized protein YjbJ (UPF0337 family)